MSNIPNNIKKMWEEAADMRKPKKPMPPKGNAKTNIFPFPKPKKELPDYEAKKPTG